MKRLLSFVVIALVAMSLTVTSFAEGSFFSDPKLQSTDQFLVKITRPEGDESTFKQSYVICGNTDKEDIAVQFLVLNNNTGNYELYENTDMETEWVVGSSGIFMKEVVLPELGANKIRIAAFNGSDRDNLAAGASYQMNDFTITVLSEDKKDQIKDGTIQITDILKELNIQMFGY